VANEQSFTFKFLLFCIVRIVIQISYTWITLQCCPQNTGRTANTL